MKQSIAFIGMGIMGVRMSKNLLDAGFPVAVYNRTLERCGTVSDAGATIAGSPREAADEADVVVLMLTGPEAIDAMMEGENGVLAGLGPKSVLVNMSTVSPEYAKELAARVEATGAVCVDAPVSGSKKPAEDGTLVILAGGPKQTVADLEPAFLAMGKKVVHCGQAGDGSAMKMAINLLLAEMMAGLSESLNLGETYGLSRELMLETILAGPLSCGLFQIKEDMLANGEYPPQFPLKHMTKDLRFVLQTADQAGAATPLCHAAFQLYRQAQGHGYGDDDFAAVREIFKDLSEK